MSTGTTRAPSLPFAPVQYDRQYQDTLNTILRQYFSQIDNAGPSAASALRPDANTVVAALNFSEVDQTTGLRRISCPTQVEYAAGKLRTGDIYYDTSTYVLKIVP
jgi:hypothetical protein